MNSDAWNVMREIDPWTVVLIVLGVLFAVREVKELFNDLTKSFGIERKSDIEKKELKDSITNLATKIENLDNKVDIRFDKMQKDLDNVTKATREELGDKINLKYKRYFEIGYIPADEFDEFVSLHDAYKTVGGNHTGDAKYKKCIESLKVQDDSTEESRINQNI